MHGGCVADCRRKCACFCKCVGVAWPTTPPFVLHHSSITCYNQKGHRLGCGSHETAHCFNPSTAVEGRRLVLLLLANLIGRLRVQHTKASRMAKGDKGKGQRPASQTKHGVVTDPRFARMHHDPRFRKFPNNTGKVEIDDRFKGTPEPRLDVVNHATHHKNHPPQACLKTLTSRVCRSLTSVAALWHPPDARGRTSSGTTVSKTRHV